MLENVLTGELNQKMKAMSSIMWNTGVERFGTKKPRSYQPRPMQLREPQDKGDKAASHQPQEAQENLQARFKGGKTSPERDLRTTRACQNFKQSKVSPEGQKMAGEAERAAQQASFHLPFQAPRLQD